MKCEKCGLTTDHVLINIFQYDGSDRHEKIPIWETEEAAVAIETDYNWTGYDLTEEEQMKTILCPHCQQFPFEHKEVQVYDIVRIVCFKSAEKALGGVSDGN